MRTKIKVKRSLLGLDETTLNQARVNFGEPLYVNDGTSEYLLVGKQTTEDDGNGGVRVISEDTLVSNAKACKLQPQNLVDYDVYYEEVSTINEGQLIEAQLINDNHISLSPKTHAVSVHYTDPEGIETNVKEVLDSYNNEGTKAKNLITLNTSNSGNYYLLGVPLNGSDNGTPKEVYHSTPNVSGAQNSGAVYFTGSGVLMGAAWNEG